MLKIIPLVGVFLFQKFLVNILVELFECHKAYLTPLDGGYQVGNVALMMDTSTTTGLALTVFGDGL